MAKKFNVDVGGDPEYEDLTAEIYCGDDPTRDFLGMINQDQGFNHLEIEIHPKPDGTPWKFMLEEFEDAIARAKKRLWELRKTEN